MEGVPTPVIGHQGLVGDQGMKWRHSRDVAKQIPCCEEEVADGVFSEGQVSVPMDGGGLASEKRHPTRGHQR